MGIITLILGMTIAVTITLCIVLFLLFQPHLKQHGYLRTPKTKSKHKKKARNAPKTPLNTPGRPSPERQSSFDVPTTSPIASAEPKSDLPTRKPSSSATSNEIDSSIATLQQSLTDDLRIRPGENRCALLLSLIWDVYFATSPNRLLPLDPQAFTPANLAQLSHEVAALFLSRHGAHLWPPAPQPAPHLLDRTLAYPRDATLTAAKRAEYVSLGLREPAVNSGIDIAYSPLGERLARYVSRVFTCPLRKRGPVAWGAVALVLDEWGLEGREVVGERLELLGGALRREVGRG